MIEKDKKILITGANGLVGTALVEELKQQGYENLTLLTRDLCDLTNLEETKFFINDANPHVVFHAAAAVYGIGGNLKNPGAIFIDNILMNTHVIEASRLAGVKKIIAMGSVAAYADPKVFPVREEHIWDGPPHKSESSYGHAKRAMLAQLLAYKESYGIDFAYVISTNLFGQNDKFNSQLGHVIPSLIRKFYEAKMNNSGVTIWGDGTAARDFLYSKDIARALVLIMNKYTGSINVASGKKTTIKDVVAILADYFEMHDKITWDSQMPNGRKYYDVDLTYLQSIGFKPIYTTQQGLKETLDWFCFSYEQNLIRT